MGTLSINPELRLLSRADLSCQLLKCNKYNHYELFINIHLLICERLQLVITTFLLGYERSSARHREQGVIWNIA
jgi:hypothetical protein